MQEREHYHENLLPEAYPFPLTRESVEKSLEEIANDPVKQVFENSDILEAENTAIFTFLTIISQSIKDDTEIFEGGVFAYKLIRDKALVNETRVPVLKKEIGSAFIFDFHQDAFTRGGLKINDFVPPKIEEIKKTEPEFINGIREMRKYCATANSFLYGAIMVYSAIKYSEKYQ